MKYDPIGERAWVLACHAATRARIRIGQLEDQLRDVREELEIFEAQKERMRASLDIPFDPALAAQGRGDR